MSKHWIQDAINPAHRGVFSAKAKSAGKGTAEFAHIVLKPKSHASAPTKRQASLALTLMRMSKKR